MVFVHSSFSVNPTNLPIKPFDRLQMLRDTRAIPPNSKVLGAYTTPKANTLFPFFRVI